MHAWLRELAAAEGDGVNRLIVCIDTLVHGGIIPARITADSPRVALDRLDLLRELHEVRAAADTPALVITAASLVMRASDSFSAVEEPEYWSTYGRTLHAFGGALHRALEADLLAAILRRFLPSRSRAPSRAISSAAACATTSSTSPRSVCTRRASSMPSR